MGDDIFAAADAALKSESDAASDSFVLVVGSKGGGKSSIINAFLNPSKDEGTKPTIGLEYSFGRRPAAPTASLGATGGALGIPRAPSDRDVAHVWELGGNSPTTLADLTSIAITAQRLPSNVLLVVADLSKPFVSLTSAARWCALLRARCADVIDKAAGGSRAGAGGGGGGGGSGASVAAALEQCRAIARARMRVGWAQRSGAPVTLPPHMVAGGGALALASTGAGVSTDGSSAAGAASGGASATSGVPLTTITPSVLPHLTTTLPEHPDAKLFNPTILPCHTIIIGTKYDTLKEVEAPRKKALAAAIRYLALAYGAHVVTLSTRDRASMTMYRALLGHCLFGSDTRRAPIIDPGSKPLYIPAGSDSLEGIGLPTAVPGAPAVAKSDLDDGALALDARLEKYLRVVKHHFPPAASDSDADAPVDLAGIPPPPASITPGVMVTFTDEASKHYEPVIDMLRSAKADETARFVKEQERRLRLEAKAAAQTTSSGSGSGGAASGAS